MSLYDIGQQVFCSGSYSSTLLKKASRLEDVNGPPRVGDVSLNSQKIEKFTQLMLV
jgi:hypothetical protein